MSRVSRLDKLYRNLVLSSFFNKGWGNPEHILSLINMRKQISNRDEIKDMVPDNYPITILHSQTWKHCRIIEGKFQSPLVLHLPEVLPEAVTDAYFQIVMPLEWKSPHRPICMHFAGTGDHHFWRRRNVIAKPLLQADIGAVILENPFYGFRKPKDQHRSNLHNVSDIFVMGICLILESQVLLRWCEKMGLGPLGVSGLSMGGHMASLAAACWPKPLVLVPCLSWSTASAVFTEGVMSESINWDILQRQYISDSRFHDRLAKLCTIVDDPFGSALYRNLKLSLAALNPDILPSRTLTSFELLDLLKVSISSGGKKSISRKRRTIVSSFSNLRIANLLKRSPSMLLKRMHRADMKMRGREAVWFMKGIMDECTHLKNFSVPFDTSLVIAICACSDGYVPREGSSKLDDLWPGSTVRYVNSGHIGAYLWHQKVFRDAIIEAFERAKGKCPLPSQFLL